ncbi:MAG: ABC transporter permease [Phascolarctobacterium sp.]|uniref:ABC transporter permease n=1 Tax=Phascolarctobacterium sp. TaxID=2049039 RepID=UPI0026DCDD15|nr:ABC transporter permease [Phascolarctobacterium sp.]MDO4921259.1 ABC transporter permease [Phascolarctobacterium sp.]
MEGIKNYWRIMYEMRYFLAHLVRLDLKNKYRRSKLGILWSIVYPLGLSIIMGIVFSVAFNYDIVSYMPYVLSGILFWDLVSASFSGGAYSILGNDGFIRQCNHPLTMYTLKSSLVTLINFIISMVALAIWVIVQNPMNMIIGLVSLPLTLIIFFAFVWAGTTIAGYTCVKYRDYPMMIPLILQVIWYVSPVFFQEDLFKSNEIIYTWFKWNPITHMLNLIREPFLNGKLPGSDDYLISLSLVLIVAIWAYRINVNNKKDLIFYL